MSESKVVACALVVFIVCFAAGWLVQPVLVALVARLLP